MYEDERQKIALFRYGIIAPAVTNNYDETLSLKGFFLDASNKVYKNPRGEDVKLAWSTIHRWYYDYKRDGFDGLVPKKRVDTGLPRKLDNELMEQIKYLKCEYPRIPSTLIHQKLIDNGSIKPNDVSLSTINRFVNKIKQDDNLLVDKDMRRYEREHINEVWCGDTSYGPYISIDAKKRRTYIIALIDDASRMIVGIDIFFNDNFIGVMSVLKSSVTKYGRPKMLNIDNGTSYRNKQMELLAARIGTVIHYNKPYTPTGKAKIERWFRTMKDRWLSVLNIKDFLSLDELRLSLFNYVNRYNNSVHSSLNNSTPSDRYFSESFMIKRLSNKDLEKSFLLEYERRVSADGVIVLDEIQYEVPYRYAKQKIIIRYSPDFSKVFIIDKTTGEYTPIKLLNKHDNSYIKREKVLLATGDSL